MLASASSASRAIVKSSKALTGSIRTPSAEPISKMIWLANTESPPSSKKPS
jgi:hypothetical protein